MKWETDREFYYPLIIIVVLLAAFGLIVLVGSVYDAAYAEDIEICDYCGAILPEAGTHDPHWIDKVHLTAKTQSRTGYPSIHFRDYCNMDHMLADVKGATYYADTYAEGTFAIIDASADHGISITIAPTEDSGHWYDFIVDWFCGVAEAQDMPAIAATEAIYDIYRVPEPTPLPPPAPSVAIYIDANGHMVAKDETGAMVNFTTLGLNCEIMAHDFEAMAKMLRKIGDMARGGKENPDGL